MAIGLLIVLAAMLALPVDKFDQDLKGGWRMLGAACFDKPCKEADAGKCRPEPKG